MLHIGSTRALASAAVLFVILFFCDLCVLQIGYWLYARTCFRGIIWLCCGSSLLALCYISFTCKFLCSILALHALLLLPQCSLLFCSSVIYAHSRLATGSTRGILFSHRDFFALWFNIEHTELTSLLSIISPHSIAFYAGYWSIIIWNSKHEPNSVHSPTKTSGGLRHTANVRLALLRELCVIRTGT